MGARSSARRAPPQASTRSPCELFAGTVVTIGTTNIAAISPENVGRDIVIAASTLPAFLRQAVDAYGSMRAAADGIGVPYSSLRGWLEKP